MKEAIDITIDNLQPDLPFACKNVECDTKIIINEIKDGKITDFKFVSVGLVK